MVETVLAKDSPRSQAFLNRRHAFSCDIGDPEMRDRGALGPRRHSWAHLLEGTTAVGLGETRTDVNR